MKRILLIIALISAILLVIYSLSNLGDKNSHSISDSLQDSKKDGFYITEYIPDKNKFILIDDSSTVQIENAWVESHWTEENRFLRSPEKRKSNGHFHFVIPIPYGINDNFNFDFALVDKGLGNIAGINPLTRLKEGIIYSLPDSIWVVLEEKNPIDTIGWQQPIITDTVLFINKNQNKF